MKKNLMILFLIISANFLFAELVVDIPFDLDIIGDDFSAVGPYTYDSEWITITNTGIDSLTYTFMYSFENLPLNWGISICDTANCFMPNWAVPIGLAAGASKQIHISVTVESTGGFTFDFTFSGGDLTEPMIYNFTFNTADNVGIENESQIPVSQIELYQNYPNPFNPETTISFNLTAEDAENAKIDIYNIKGQKIKTFPINQLTNQPVNQITWNGTDENGNTVPSGMYFYKLISDGNSGRYTSTKKMILLK